MSTMRKILACSLLVVTSLVMSSAKSYAATPFYIFAKEGRVFLGCTNCDKYDSDSLNNKYGDYGSSYSRLSIHNAYGDYGSRYSDTSACNPNARNPPIVVDGDGNIQGYLTVNHKIRAVTLDPRILGACNK